MELDEEELRRVIRSTLEEEREYNKSFLDTQVLKVVSTILQGFGIHETERREIQDDFNYLRRWRKGSERFSTVGMTALLTLLIGGMVSALWIGVKSLMGK